MRLFIVESPTKAKTIKRFLGKDFVVKATAGHIRDLPSKNIGVDEETLRARYVYIKGKRKIVEDLKRTAKRVKEIFIGTDPDREGEAIAYFVKEELKKINPNIKRVVFYEITPEAIKKSLGEGRDIDMNAVHAQFARRILDRLIGYKISPYLWRRFRNFKLSAGRVQSPALRLIVEREREIREFKKKTFYYVKARFIKDGSTFEAVYDYRYENPSDAQIILEKIREGVFRVVEIERKREKIPPPKPFITSSLQSEANALLGFSPEKTQKIAQRMYEEGYITYPRTDSHRMNEKKGREFMKFIEKDFGREYVGKLRRFKESGFSQGAHECIRPVDINKIPVEEEEKMLFELILRRTLASLMAPAMVERVKVKIEVISPSLKEPIYLIAKGNKLIFDGWTVLYPYQLEGKELPNLEEGEVLKLEEVFIERKETKPPPRYTEGTLVKTLEKLGIGRPSTYAVLTSLLKKRGYVRLKNKTLIPSDIAFYIIDYLKEEFPDLVDYSLTARMEKELDEIEEGKRNWKEVVKKITSEVMPYG